MKNLKNLYYDQLMAKHDELAQKGIFYSKTLEERLVEKDYAELTAIMHSLDKIFDNSLFLISEAHKEHWIAAYAGIADLLDYYCECDKLFNASAFKEADLEFTYLDKYAVHIHHIKATLYKLQSFAGYIDPEIVHACDKIIHELCAIEDDIRSNLTLSKVQCYRLQKECDHELTFADVRNRQRRGR